MGILQGISRFNHLTCHSTLVARDSGLDRNRSIRRATRGGLDDSITQRAYLIGQKLEMIGFRVRKA